VPVAGLRGARPGTRVRVSLRPEDLRLAAPEAAGAVRGRVVVKTFLGATTRLDVDAGALRLRVDVPSSDAGRLTPRQEIWVLPAAPGRVIETVTDGEAP
jgi:ABC-type Fe3+/spermidine/putrescine transport system ATPase subunit